MKENKYLYGGACQLDDSAYQIAHSIINPSLSSDWLRGRLTGTWEIDATEAVGTMRFPDSERCISLFRAGIAGGLRKGNAVALRLLPPRVG